MLTFASPKPSYGVGKDKRLLRYQSPYYSFFDCFASLKTSTKVSLS